MKILLTMHIERFAFMLRARHVIIGSINKRARIEYDRRLIYVFSNHISDRSNGNISYLIIYGLEPFVNSTYREILIHVMSIKVQM